MMLMPAAAWKEGETYDDLSTLYGRVISQWQTEMNHVTQIVGGFNSQEKAIGQEGRIFSLVEKERQAEAVKYLLDNAFTTPMWLVDEEILRRIEAVGRSGGPGICLRGQDGGRGQPRHRIGIRESPQGGDARPPSPPSAIGSG